MARTGRPSKKTNEKLSQAVKMAEKGFTDADIADVLGIDRSTLNNWKKENPDFFDSLKSAKVKADERVEKALYKRAIGFRFKEKEEAEKIIKGVTYTLNKVTTKFVAPETLACIYWLKNRKPETWRDNPVPDTGADADTLLKLIIDDPAVGKKDNGN